MKKKNIFLIPARGNSVGVPNKNLYSLKGQTLVQRAIRVSLAAGLGEVIVSSDSEKILDHALEVGANRVIKRPDEISDADSKTIETVIHTLDNIDYDPDYVFLIQPTSPLRKTDDIEKSFELIKNDKTAISLASICRHMEPHPMKMFEKNGSYIRHLISSDNAELPRQALKDVYKLNGAIYILSKSSVIERKILSDKTIFYEMPDSRSINIDSKWDIILLNALIQNMEVNLEDY